MTTLLRRVRDGWRTGKAKDRTREDAAVLDALRAVPMAGAHEMHKRSGVRYARLYMTLARLEQAGRVKSGWVEWPENPVGKRRMYWVEDGGRQ